MNRKKKNGRHIFACLLYGAFVFLGVLAYCSAKWYINTYGDIGFDAILFTLLSGVKATASDIIVDYLKRAFLPCLCITGFAVFMFAFPWRYHIRLTIKKWKPIKLFPFSNKFMAVLSVLVMLALIVEGAATIGMIKWFEMRSQQTTIFQDEYIAPTADNVVFDNEKRNLIYIYLESMETTFFSKEQGGALPYNVIPELYQLAQDNINFSQNEDVGGGYDTSAAYNTISAMTAQTSGLPLKTYYAPETKMNTVGVKYPFLPGATTLCNILHENGYYQTLMVGSDATFGGRQQLYLQHGADKVYDLFTAREDGLIPPDYRVWWGFEDMYLFDYAKRELSEIAEKEQPFSFTLLTVDTHHIGGYVCEMCQEQYAEQYENVYACSSRQVYEFVQWIQEQPFYENTTIIISGDHRSMDREYMDRNVPDDYVRRVYNCIINPAVEPQNTKNREFVTMDMFPTTLTAIGATLTENRLGLGTDLFSGVPTLLEQHGLEWWNAEMRKSSDYYIAHFAVGGES